MSQILMAILIYALPVLILVLPFVLICTIRLKHFDSSENKPTESTNKIPDEPDFSELEKKLNILIKNNKIALKEDNFRQELTCTPSHIIASYLNINRQKLKGFFLFQLIYDLIENNTDSHKIIRILRHHLPTCSTPHLYALLRSCKEFLNLSLSDNQKNLKTELKKNHLQPSLLYMQEKIYRLLNQIPDSPIYAQQSLIEKTTIYGLIFAAICEFYNSEITEKMLNFAYHLSPETFEYWHSVPHHPKIKRKRATHTPFTPPYGVNQRPPLNVIRNYTRN